VETRRKPGVGEIPWTTANGTPENSDEDMSSVVHLAGFFVTHCSANVHKQTMTCPSRASEFFTGWEEGLEPPIGRPIAGWDDIEPRAGRPSVEESKATSELAKGVSVWDAGSSVADGPRAAIVRVPIQGRTFQDVDSETNLGSLKTLQGEPLWLVFRKKTFLEIGVCCVERPAAKNTSTAQKTRRS
jgi:hypothetical protein